MGEGLVDAFTTDTRNMTVGAATLTQPLFMGGKIIAYDEITKYAERLRTARHRPSRPYPTDRTRFTGNRSIRKNWQRFFRAGTEAGFGRRQDDGVATKADGLSVKVKVNEAEIILSGRQWLEPLKNAFVPLCGLPLETDFRTGQ